MKKLLSIFLVLLVFSACSSQKSTTSTPITNEQVNKMLEDQSFTFVARQVYPPGGRSRYLTETYTLTVNGNKVVADLPYFGKATQATIGGEGGIKFTSEKYKYEKAPNKKGWKVTIRPEENTDVQVCYLSVLENGSANLSVSSNSRQTISYDGTIAPVKSSK
jgi:Domain of unknown function (DUF4251)